MMRTALPILAALLLASCADTTPVETKGTDNPNLAVSRMFTTDGCTVYRFYDTGYPHYFANCRGSTMTDYTKTCGKGCTTTFHDDIPTETK